MKKFSTLHPLLLVGLTGLALILGQYLWQLVLPGASESDQILFGKMTACLLAVIFLGTLGLWRKAGFGTRLNWHSLAPFIPLTIIPLLTALFRPNAVVALHPFQIVDFALVALMTGFAEEAIFRGIGVTVLLRRGTIQAALLSSLVFGAVHFANLLVGANLLATLVQVIVAFLFGIASAALLISTRAILPLMVIHAIEDFISFVASGGVRETSTPTVSGVLMTLLLFIPVAVYGMWLLRRKKPEYEIS
jgi:membrane protease YdiL (CAAX protease family)